MSQAVESRNASWTYGSFGGKRGFVFYSKVNFVENAPTFACSFVKVC